MMNTSEPEDIRTIRDTGIKTQQASLHHLKCGIKEGIPDFGDIDPLKLGLVYSKK